MQLRDYCLSGLGLACLQESYFQDGFASGQIEPVLTDWCASFTGHYLYYPSRRQPTAAFRLILDALRAAVD
ncbi:LysR substrate-binding domain-containing protein [Gemmobacter caeruleus]|uniref:LysR substrate-binding domain-containing protein n=1 Tax=Gemmobacter caeruleus TaxID=2595004 RepID=UPI001EF14617|nr:LysR substrate-binding domain-containing protein [Gemmobacter caeruleus]